MMLKLITAALLVAHGLGHAMAPQAAFVPPGAFPKTAHMVATGMTIDSASGKAMSVLWVIPLIGFVLGTYGLWTGVVVATGARRLSRRFDRRRGALVGSDACVLVSRCACGRRAGADRRAHTVG